MGVFDFLKGKRPSSAPPPGDRPSGPPASGPPPEGLTLPARGTVTSFDQLDAVGKVSLEGGQELRFGRSACRGFEPVAGVHVELRAVAPHPRGGWRATELGAVSASEVETLLEVRDTAAGYSTPSTLPPPDALTTAREIGLLTFALDAPMPTRVAVRELLASLDLPGELDLAPKPQLRVAGHTFPMIACGAPLPVAELDTRLAKDAAAAAGQSFLTICGGPFSFRASAALSARAGNKPFDAWTGWGLRECTGLAAKLAERATLVVVHPAGQVVHTPAAWRRLLGDVTRDDCRPFTAYVDLGFSPDRRSVMTSGMIAWALPDVRVESSEAAGSDEVFGRARDAILVAGSVMVHGGRPLAEGDVLRVPSRVEVGPYPLKFDPRQPLSGASRWVVIASDEDLVDLALDE